MAAHGSRVAFCTDRAAEACRKEGLEVAERSSPNGTTAWLVADDPDGKDDERLLHGATSYLSMLHDRPRNAAYAAGLAAAPAPRLALDLGAGTGLLSMLACRGRPGSRAVACEAYGACADLATRVVRENGLEGQVAVVNKVASDLEVGPGLDLPERADLCVFEVFDSQLLGEGVLPMLRDAHARLLEPGAALVPRRVTIRAVLVECAALAAADLPELRGAPWPMMLGQLGLAPGGGSSGSAARPLSQAWAAASIDFARLPRAGPVAAAAEVEADAAGSAHAVAWWWELDMGGGHLLSSWSDAEQPGGAAALRHHWRPCLSFLAPRRVRAGERLSVAAVHDDEAVWFAWSRPGEDPPPRWVEGVTAIPPERERLLIMGSESWAPLLREAVSAGLEACAEGGGELLLLPADDGLLLPLVPEGSPRRALALLPPRAGQRLQESGRLPSGVRTSSLDAAAGEPPFRAAFVEPFARGDPTPWSLVHACRKRLAEAHHLLAPGARVIPEGAVVLASLVECRGAWLARQPLARVEGLDLSAASPALVPRGEGPLSCQMCEIAWRPLSAPVAVLRLDLVARGPWAGACDLVPTASGECHAVALWVDFDLGGGKALSTGPPPPGAAPTGWSQALQLLPVPVPATAGAAAVHLAVELSASFGLKVGVAQVSDSGAARSAPQAKCPRLGAWPR